jgi:hypothetical protein
MKKALSEFIKSLGGTTRYCGKLKTLFIHHPRKGDDQDILDECIKKFGRHLPFRILPQSKTSSTQGF